jgi:uncharacterized protein YbjT (DUF2867 family)
MQGVKEQGALFLPAGDGKNTPIDPRGIAAVAVKVLTTPGHEGKIYELTGPELPSHAEMVEKIAGRNRQAAEIRGRAGSDGARRYAGDGAFV